MHNALNKAISIKSMNKIFSVFIFFHFSLILGCNDLNEKTVKVDFIQKSENSNERDGNDSVAPLRVAVAAIISPRETYTYYNELFKYISKKINRPIVFEQRKTYSEVNDMLINQTVDIAFVCTGAYIRNKKYCDVLVVPVCKNLPYYQGYIIVRKNSAFKSLKDLKGKSFAFTDPLSNTGKLYPELRVKKISNMKAEDFFSKIIYTNAHDMSIELVSKSLVDGASVNSLIYDYLASTNPERIENLRIIEKSEYFGIPPVVTSKGINKELRKKLEELFLNVNDDPDGQIILRKLLIDKFIITGDTLYNNVCSEYKESNNE